MSTTQFQGQITHLNRRSTATQLQQKSASLSKMLFLIWWLTAAGVWATAGCAWIFQHLHWVASLESPGAFVFALSALIIIGFWLNDALKRLEASGACLVYLLIILLNGFLFSRLFTFSSIARV
ncbi:hypothetical protein ACSHM0_004053, partial [Escherichia coli]